MADVYNLGRVQGISLWVADGEVTTTGTITLTESSMHPLINDNVVDTNGNVFKIIAVSGTNPYTITTSGTPIYQIKGQPDTFNNLPAYYNTDDIPTATDYPDLGLYNLETNEIYFKTYNKYGYDNGNRINLGDLGVTLNVSFGSDNTLSYYESVDDIFKIINLDSGATIFTLSTTSRPIVYYLDKTFFIYTTTFNELIKHDIDTSTDTTLSFSGFNLSNSLTYGEKYSDNKYRMFSMNTSNVLNYFEYDSTTNAITLLDTKTITDIGSSHILVCVGVINFNKGEYLLFFRYNNSSNAWIYIYYFNGTTLNQLSMIVATRSAGSLVNVYKNNNILLLSGSQGFGNYEFNMDTKQLSTQQGITTDTDSSFRDTSPFNFNNARFVKVSGNDYAYIPTSNPYEYKVLEVTSTSSYSLESLNAIMLTSGVQTTYQIPINKWYQFIDDLINKEDTTLTINNVTYSDFIAKEDNTLSSKNCIINLTNYTINITNEEEEKTE